MSGDPTYAAAPFDHEKADIILRSSDNVYFRVFKLFLSLASPVFETLFDIPQPAISSEDQEARDGLAVIPVTEDSGTLDTLLRFCYPCTLAEDPNLDVLQDAVNVLDAAKKYSLSAIEKKARQAISNQKILEAEPLQCFAIAHRGHLREETLLAAKCTLAQPLIPSWFLEIELISASSLLSLVTYHQRCGDAVYALRLDLSWIKTHYENRHDWERSWLSGQSQYRDSSSHGFHNYGCSTSPTSDIRYENCACARVENTSKYHMYAAQTLQWWDTFMEETFTALREKPCESTLQASAEKTVREVKAKKCRACSPKIAEGMRDFVELFARKMEEAVSQVSCISVSLVNVHHASAWFYLQIELDLKF